MKTSLFSSRLARDSFSRNHLVFRFFGLCKDDGWCDPMRTRATSNLGAPGSRVASHSGYHGRGSRSRRVSRPRGRDDGMGRHPASFVGLLPRPRCTSPTRTSRARSRHPTVAHIDEQTADALEEMDDEFADDAFLERYRRERIAELKARAAPPLRRRRPHHPRRLHLRGDRPVGGPPRRRPPPSSRVPRLRARLPRRRRARAQNPFCKFTSIPGGECIWIPRLQLMPTLLVYRHRDVARTFVGLDAFGAGRPRKASDWHSASADRVSRSRRARRGGRRRHRGGGGGQAEVRGGGCGEDDRGRQRTQRAVEAKDCR